MVMQNKALIYFKNSLLINSSYASNRHAYKEHNREYVYLLKCYHFFSSESCTAERFV